MVLHRRAQQFTVAWLRPSAALSMLWSLRLVLLFLVLAPLILYLGYTIYWNYPGLRLIFLEEGQLIENVTSSLYLLAAGICLLAWRRTSGRRRIPFLLLTIFAFVFFLEETTYGLTLFGDAIPWRQIRIDDVKVNTVHDFLFLIYTEIKRHTLIKNITILYVLGGVTVLAPVIILARFWNRIPREYVASFLLMLLCVTFGLASLTLDLDLIHNNRAFMIEELLEMNGALAVVLASLALPRRAPTSEAAAAESV